MSINAFSAQSALAALRSGARHIPPPPLEQAAFDAAHTAVAEAKAAPALLDAVVATWQRADSLWAATRSTSAFALGVPPAACRKGCGWCCHQRVGAAAIEVLAMARALADRREARDALAGWGPGKHCAFLKDGSCSVYDIRPLKCRSLWHLDERACMAKYAGLPAVGAAPNPGFQAEPKQIYEGALKGLALPLIKAGRDCPGVELMPALQAVAEMDDAAERWWRGESVFPEAARLDWFPKPVKKRRR